MLVDLSGVDEVNDTLGHGAGDALLVQVADRLRAAAGERLVARLVGDEFAVLTHGRKDVDELVAPLLRLLTGAVELDAVTVSVARTRAARSCRRPTAAPRSTGRDWPASCCAARAWRWTPRAAPRVRTCATCPPWTRAR